MWSSSMEEEELSNYELLRLRNVENNRKLLRSLGLINDTKENSTPKQPKTRRRRESRSPIPPTRPKSQRILKQKEKGIFDTPAYDKSEWFIPRLGRAQRARSQMNNEYICNNMRQPETSLDQEQKIQENSALFTKTSNAFRLRIASKRNLLETKQESVVPTKEVVLSVLITVIVVMFLFRGHSECCMVAALTTILVGLICNLLTRFFIFLFTS